MREYENERNYYINVRMKNKDNKERIKMKINKKEEILINIIEGNTRIRMKNQ